MQSSPQVPAGLTPNGTDRIAAWIGIGVTLVLAWSRPIGSLVDALQPDVQGMGHGMVPAAALSILALSCALAMLLSRGDRRTHGSAAAVVASCVAVWSAALELRHVSGLPGNDFVSRALPRLGGESGRMGPATAVVLVLLAFALILGTSRRRDVRYAALLTAVVAVCASTGIFFAWIAALPLFLPAGAPRMTLLTSAALSVLSLSVATFLGLRPAVSRIAFGARPGTEFPASERAARRIVIAWFAVLAVAGPLTVAAYLRGHVQQVRFQATERLGSVAELTVMRLQSWYSERIGDAWTLTRVRLIVGGLGSVKPAGAGAAAFCGPFLEGYRRTYGYESIVVLDHGPRPFAAEPAGTSTQHDQLEALISRARATHDVAVGEIHPIPGGRTCLDFVAPVIASDGRVLGSVWLRIDPARQISPRVTWPVSSRSAETFLVRSQGAWIVNLTPLRHRNIPPLTLKLAADRVVAGRAIASSTGQAVEGVDYRGVRALAVAHRVPRTNWYVIARIDASEAYAPAWGEAVRMAASLLAIAALLLLSVRLLWRQRQSSLLEREREAERRRLEAAERLAAVMQHANDGIVLSDENRRIVDVNRRALAMYDYTREEFLALRRGDIRAPGAPFSEREVQEDSRHPRGTIVETMHRRRDGSTFPVEVSSRVIDLGGRVHRISLIRDITERRAQFQQLERLSRMYRALGDINAAIVHAEEKVALKREVCRILVESGGFNLAWIGGPDFHRRVAPEVQHGDVSGYLDGIVITADDSASGRGPTGTAVREGRTVVLNDLLHAEMSTPWHERAAAAGLRASMALPLRERGEVCGALTVYASEQDFFGDREIELVEEAAASLSFAFDVLARNDERHATLKALEQSLARFRLLVAATPAIIYTCRTSDFAPTFVSENVTAILGHQPDDFTSDPAFWLEHIHPEDRDEAIEVSAQLRAGERILREYRFRQRDGRWVWMEDETRVVVGPGGEPLMYAGCWIDVTQRKEAELALRAREEISSAVLEQAADAIVLIDADTSRFVEFNEAACRGLGYTRDEFAQLSIATIQAAHSSEEIHRNIGILLAQGTLDFETRHRRSDGEVRQVHVRARCLTIRGHPYIAAVWNDITERKLADAQLRKLSRAIEQAPVSIIITDLDGAIEYANPHFSEVTGYSVEEVLDANPRILKSGLTPDSTYREMWQALTAGAVWRGELYNRRKNGEVYVEIAVIASVAGDDGKATHYVAVKEDITARKRAEDALRRSEEQYRFITENTADIIWLYDLGRDGFVYVSPAFERILGYPVEDALRLSPQDLLPEELAEKHRTRIFARASAIEGGDESQIAQTDELVNLTRDGRRIDVEVLTTLIRDDEGRVTRVLGVTRDITERVSAARELQQSRDRLEQERNSLARRVEERTADLSHLNAELARAARAKDDFLANMSHELRTPLNAILALSETLLEEVRGPLNARQQASVRTIDASGRHLLALITDILDLSKVEAGRMDLQTEQIGVAEICDASLAFVKETAVRKKIQIGTQLDEPRAFVQADSKRLKQMLVNLLSNAVKFTGEGGRVTLEVVTDRDAGVIRFSVRDTGIGMTPEETKRLFQPFVQLDTSLTREHEGTGLGLALVRRLAELHGGTAGVESEPGVGSCFTIVLPWNAAEKREGTSGHEPPAAGAAVHLAAIVDDSQSAGDQLARYLGEQQIEARFYSQPEGVVEQVAELRPDVVFLDLLMPERSGWEVLAQLRSDLRTSNIPVVIVSVLDERPAAEAAGAFGYLVKPISRDEVRRVLNELNGSAAMTRASVATPAAAQAAGPAARVLLADDGEFNIIAIGDYLVDLGFDVTVARNGEEAVALAESTSPELILMDVQMPKMDGLEATRLLRQRAEFAKIPIIALTGLAMQGDRERCLAAGATDYLSKPVSPKSLVQVMRTYLGR